MSRPIIKLTLFFVFYFFLQCNILQISLNHDLSLSGCAIRTHIVIISNLYKNKVVATEYETKIIILLTFASNWPVKDTIVYHVVLYNVAQCQAMSDVLTITNC